MIERFVTTFFFLASVLFLYLVSFYPITLGSHPSMGLMPVTSGIAAILVSATLLVSACRQRPRPVPRPVNELRLTCILIGSFFYAAVIKSLGYAVTNFLFLFYLSKVANASGWKVPFIFSFSCAIGLYLLFDLMLGINLP